MMKHNYFLSLSGLVLFLLAGTLPAQDIVSVTHLGHQSEAELKARFGTPLIEYGIDMYKVLYTTVDVHGLPDTASGLLVVPDDPGKVYPVLCYQHGTAVSKDEVPSNVAGDILPLLWGGLGYVTSAADYLGLGASRGFHPYVHAASEAWAALDMLRAVKAWIAQQDDVHINDQLFLTGYSQGGHASMALHRAIELEHADEFTVTAAAHLSGPYSISGVMRDRILSEAEYLFSGYIPNTVMGYNEVYQLYDSLEQVFKPEYVPWIELYYDGQINLIQLSAALNAQLIASEGATIPRHMLQDTLVAAIQTNPDHPFNLALADNDTHTWPAQAPTRLYYCTADDQVPYLNSIVADSVMNALGAEDLFAYDVSPTSDHGECVSPAIYNAALFFQIYQQIGTVTATTAVEPPALKVWPNPVTDRVFVQGLPESTDLQLFDASGRLCRSWPNRQGGVELPVYDLPKGIYLLHATSAHYRWHKRIVVD